MMEPHTALLCDAHVWVLAECPICALEREITAREMADSRVEELEKGRDTESVYVDIHPSDMHKYHAERAGGVMSVKEIKGKGYNPSAYAWNEAQTRIEELSAKYARSGEYVIVLEKQVTEYEALIDRAIKVWHSSEGDDMNIVIKDMRKAREGKW